MTAPHCTSLPKPKHLPPPPFLKHHSFRGHNIWKKKKKTVFANQVFTRTKPGYSFQKWCSDSRPAADQNQDWTFCISTHFFLFTLFLEVLFFVIYCLDLFFFYYYRSCLDIYHIGLVISIYEREKKNKKILIVETFSKALRLFRIWIFFRHTGWNDCFLLCVVNVSLSITLPGVTSELCCFPPFCFVHFI